MADIMNSMNRYLFRALDGMVFDRLPKYLVTRFTEGIVLGYSVVVGPSATGVASVGVSLVVVVVSGGSLSATDMLLSGTSSPDLRHRFLRRHMRSLRSSRALS